MSTRSRNEMDGVPFVVEGLMSVEYDESRPVSPAARCRTLAVHVDTSRPGSGLWLGDCRELSSLIEESGNRGEVRGLAQGWDVRESAVRPGRRKRA